MKGEYTAVWCRQTTRRRVHLVFLRLQGVAGSGHRLQI